MGDLPNPRIEPRSSELQAGSLPAEPPGKPPTAGYDHFQHNLKSFLLILAFLTLCLKLLNGNKNPAMGRRYEEIFIVIVAPEVLNNSGIPDRNMENINWKTCLNDVIGKILR